MWPGGQAHGRAGGDKRLGDNPALQNVWLGAEAAVGPRNGPGRVAVFDQESLPGELFLASGGGTGKPVAMRFEKATHVIAKGVVGGAVGQVHLLSPWSKPRTTLSARLG